MTGNLLILLIPLVAILLISAQALWRHAVVSDKLLEGSFGTIVVHTITNPKIWLGGILYVLTTAVYLFLFTKFKFFVVQLSITGLALVFSTMISYYIFHEKITIINIIGLVVILVGLALVVQK